MSASVHVLISAPGASDALLARVEEVLGSGAAAALREVGLAQGFADTAGAEALQEARGPEVRVGVWPRPQGILERSGELGWASARPERAATPAGTAPINAYEDGLALVVDLDRGAQEWELENARAALDCWCAGYEGANDEMAYRNCDAEAELGGRTIRVWADRIRDPEGDDNASMRLAWIGQTLEGAIGASRWRIEAAGEDRELERRLGTPVLTTAAALAAASQRPDASPELAQWAPTVVFIARVVCRFTLGQAAGAFVSALGVIAASVAWRRRLGARELGVAAASALASLGYGALALWDSPVTLGTIDVLGTLQIVDIVAVLFWYALTRRALRQAGGAKR